MAAEFDSCGFEAYGNPAAATFTMRNRFLSSILSNYLNPAKGQLTSSAKASYRYLKCAVCRTSEAE